MEEERDAFPDDGAAADGAAAESPAGGAAEAEGEAAAQLASAEQDEDKRRHIIAAEEDGNRAVLGEVEPTTAADPVGPPPLPAAPAEAPAPAPAAAVAPLPTLPVAPAPTTPPAPAATPPAPPPVSPTSAPSAGAAAASPRPTRLGLWIARQADGHAGVAFYLDRACGPAFDLENGTCVELKEHDGRWAKVVASGRIGWVKFRNLVDVSPEQLRLLGQTRQQAPLWWEHCGGKVVWMVTPDPGAAKSAQMDCFRHASRQLADAGCKVVLREGLHHTLQELGKGDAVCFAAPLTALLAGGASAAATIGAAPLCVGYACGEEAELFRYDWEAPRFVAETAVAGDSAKAGELVAAAVRLRSGRPSATPGSPPTSPPAAAGGAARASARWCPPDGPRIMVVQLGDQWTRAGWAGHSQPAHTILTKVEYHRHSGSVEVGMKTVPGLTVSTTLLQQGHAVSGNTTQLRHLFRECFTNLFDPRDKRPYTDKMNGIVITEPAHGSTTHRQRVQQVVAGAIGGPTGGPKETIVYQGTPLRPEETIADAGIGAQAEVELKVDARGVPLRLPEGDDEVPTGMVVFVTLPSGEKYPIDVSPAATVRDLLIAAVRAHRRTEPVQLAPAIYLAAKEAFALYACGHHTGIVLSVGHTYSRAVAVVRGQPVLGATQIGKDLAGRQISDFLARSLRERKANTWSVDAAKLKSTCRVLLREELGPATRGQLPPDLYLPEKEHQVAALTVNERWRAPEVLFSASDSGGVAKLVVRCASALSPELRRAACRAVVLDGGTTAIRGFAARVNQELWSQPPPEAVPANKRWEAFGPAEGLLTPEDCDELDRGRLCHELGGSAPLGPDGERQRRTYSLRKAAAGDRWQKTWGLRHRGPDIVAVTPGSPAQVAKLVPGLRVLTCNGIDCCADAGALGKALQSATGHAELECALAPSPFAFFPSRMGGRCMWVRFDSLEYCCGEEVHGAWQPLLCHDPPPQDSVNPASGDWAALSTDIVDTICSYLDPLALYNLRHEVETYRDPHTQGWRGAAQLALTHSAPILSTARDYDTQRGIGSVLGLTR
eukprot:TRINITY_DN15511_c1_g1_i1.p1 TRINITY_DN15511_c1_g1~~TRINITY_DN15511_c1_g1_i1.p1  ORF type:complete len:1086 (+),score=180.87 TRINITY_DN15511_c1_g1_i1:86-3259(+)